MEAIIVILVTTAFGYGIHWLLAREPLTTVDLAVGALAGFAGAALARALMAGSVGGALLVGCALALGLQALRQRPALEER
ncbi:MAG TPA: hypothetical protein VNL77_21645 [Roseiflexaceae bacterium]|nr:hypothetical protein [Roseiflexaceae bacterium]